MISAGRPFYKMSGSGNDFVMVDARREPPGKLAEPETVQRICARRTGVGADGIVFLGPSSVADVSIVYLNADGSRAEFCGNATLCTTRLSAELGIGDVGRLSIETDSGVVTARMNSGEPEIDLQPARGVQERVGYIATEGGERRIGFAEVGVPHLIIECDDISTVDVVGRGRMLRRHKALPKGANVNFVSRKLAGSAAWGLRTYERGVEAETLACGSGSVATAILLNEWGLAEKTVALETSSGRTLGVRLRLVDSEWLPSLSGEGRVVYQAQLSEI